MVPQGTRRCLIVDLIFCYVLHVLYYFSADLVEYELESIYSQALRQYMGYYITLLLLHHKIQQGLIYTQFDMNKKQKENKTSQKRYDIITITQAHPKIHTYLTQIMTYCNYTHYLSCTEKRTKNRITKKNKKQKTKKNQMYNIKVTEITETFTCQQLVIPLGC